MRRRAAALAVGASALALAWWLWPVVEPTPVAATTLRGSSIVDGGGELPFRAPALTLEPPPEVADGGAWFRIVSSADGQGVAGASVELSRSFPGVVISHGLGPVTTAVTDERGYAAFARVPDGALSARVQRLFFDSPMGFPFRPNSTHAIDPLLPFVGVVLDLDRKPVAGARVTSQQPPVQSTASAADGSFTLQLAVWDFLVGEKDGAIGAATYLDPKNLNGSKVEIVLGHPPQVSARVLDREGKPLADVEVELQVGAVRLGQRTGGDGLWHVPVVKYASGMAVFRKPGYLGAKQERGLDDGWKDVVLSRGARLEGLVLNPDRTPVAGAEVRVWARGPDPVPEPVVTDARGRFTISGIGAAKFSVVASLGGRRGETELELADGAQGQSTVVLAPDLIDVPFEVLENDGGLVTGVGVVATPIPDQGWKSTAQFAGDLGLCRGRFHLAVTADDGRSAERTLEVDPRPGMEPIRFTLSPLPEPEPEAEEPRTQTELRVLVKTPAGSPVAGATVFCADSSAVTGTDGQATLVAHLRERDWPLQVIATLDGSSAVARPTSAASRVEVVLGPRRTLRGRVLGQLPPGTLVVTYRSGTQNDTIALNGNAFAIDGVDATRTFVCVRLDIGPSTIDELGCTVVDGSEEAVIEVGRKGTVELTALDETGKPLEEPLVYVNRLRQTELEAPGGHLHFEVSPGTHILVLNAVGRRARYEARFVVRPGELTQLGTVQLK